MPRLAAAAMIAVASLALPACDDDPASPDGGDLPIEWFFDSGLEGWTTGAAATATNGGAAEVTGGEVILRGWGEPGIPDSWITRSVALPSLAYTVRVRATADCIPNDGGGDTAVRILLTRGGTTATLLDWTTIDDDSYHVVSADLHQFAGQTVTLRIDMDDEGDQEGGGTGEFESLCIDEISVIGD